MLQHPASRKRSGGPRTAAGKASSSRNALKSGITVGYWLDDAEQQEYDELLSALLAQYQPCGAVLPLLLDQLARLVVKLRRLERIEAALHQKARITTEHVAQQQASADNSLASYLPPDAAGRELALQLSVQAALPELERLDLLARHQSTLGRQISRLLADIKHAAEADAALRAKRAVVEQPGAAAGPTNPSNPSNPSPFNALNPLNALAPPDEAIDVTPRRIKGS